MVHISIMVGTNMTADTKKAHFSIMLVKQKMYTASMQHVFITQCLQKEPSQHQFTTIITFGIDITQTEQN